MLCWLKSDHDCHYCSHFYGKQTLVSVQQLHNTIIHTRFSTHVAQILPFFAREIYIGKLIHHFNNGLWPVRRQAFIVIGTNADALLITSLGTKFRNFNLKCNNFQSRKELENIVCKMTASMSRPQFIILHADNIAVIFIKVPHNDSSKYIPLPKFVFVLTYVCP